MKQVPWASRRLVGSLLLSGLSLLVGCTPQQPYSDFAKTGSAYTGALDLLLVQTGNISVDTESEQLLASHATNVRANPPAGLAAADVDKANQVNSEYLAQLQAVRKQARLLANYFNALNNLATSDAPKRSADAAEKFANNLNELSKSLGGSSVLTQVDQIKTVTSLFVNFQLRAELKNELSKRKEAIDLELKVHEVLLEKIANSIKGDLKLQNQALTRRYVLDPLTSASPLSREAQEQFKIDRLRVLNLSTTVDELETAKDAARKLRESFEELVTGTMTRQKLDAALADVDAILAVIESYKGASK